ncbi:sigma-70 family RNA polymerase sigma factor [Streptomyces sp. NPDC052396]|uniref:sigma-70 family RNA polymerase sigma factor n=1 Tax=Streptomyces sp. NPDC052396 TaxID=3365689 RepID=UPI0037CFA8A3
MGVDERDEPQRHKEADRAPARQVPGIPAQGGPAAPGPAASGEDGTDDGANVPQQRKGARRGAHARTDGSARAGGDVKAAGNPQAEGSSGAEESSPVNQNGDTADPADDGTAEAEPPPSDAELVARIREGQDSPEQGPANAAYAELYRRHAAAVRGYARTCCRDLHTADDLTNEVFARTLQAVRRGKGPDTAVRAYLLTTVRHVAAAWTRTARREQLVEDFAEFAASAEAAAAVEVGAAFEPGADVRAMQQAEASLAVRAFHSLPERWQMVLWHTTVENESPGQVAPLLGLTANATAVLAHRAREGLKQAYLQAHVSSAQVAGGGCAQYADRLGAYARGGLRMRAERGMRKHLESCARCRTAALELADVNAQLRALLPVAVIGWFTAGASVKVVASAVGVTGGAAGAAAASGAGTGSGGAATAAGTAAGTGTGAVSGSATAAGSGAGAAGAGSTAGTGAGSATAAGSGTGAASGTAGAGAGSSAGSGTGSAAAGEGISVPAKVGIAAGAMLAAGAVIAYALTGDPSASPPRKVQANSSVAPAVPTPTPTPEPSAPPAPAPPPEPTAPPAPERSAAPPPDAPRQRAAAPRPAPTPPPSHHAAPPVAPAVHPHRPKPAAPTRPPAAKPAHPAKPAPRPVRPPHRPSVYQLTQLELEGIGEVEEPETGLEEGYSAWPSHQFQTRQASYRHGVTATGSSEVSIDLHRPCASFDALVGVDEESLGDGAVRFVVYGDGIRLWSSGLVRAGHPALPVHVSLHGHRKLRLVAEPKEPFEGVALVDWARARISC